LSLEQIIERLKAETEPTKWVASIDKHKVFEGEITNEGFKISRFIGKDQNCFLPIVHGSFKQKASGVSVVIKMRLHLFVMIFMCVWCAVICWSMRNFMVDTIGFIVIGFLNVFPWAVASAAFWIEAKKQKQMLIKILT